MKLEFEFSLITIHLNSIEFITYIIYKMYIQTCTFITLNH